MKHIERKKQLVAALLIVILLLAGCGNAGSGNSGSGGDSGASVGTDFDGSRTLLIYMVGSDLEPSTAAASNDLTEIEESGVNLDKVNVLVFTGGAPTWHSEIPTDKNALLELTSEGFKVKETFDVKSMGDSENLARFLNYSCENYSSGEYDLILWDHGCGPIMGYGIDKQFENDTLTLPELKEALSNSPFGKDKKLGFIGCDACLMASAELASVVSDYAEILVSSQEAEPSFGWNYAFMSEADSLNALDFSKSIVDKYMEYSEEFFANNKFFQSDVTLSVVNLNEAKNIENSINTLFAEAIDDVSGAYNKLAVSRVESRDLGRASTGSDYDLVDLQSLLDCMRARYPKETEVALDALNKAVLYNKTNTPECSGLSLYYPFYNKIYFENSWEQGYKDLGVFTDYFTYMQRFSKVWLGTDGKDVFNTALIAEYGDEELTYTMKLTPEQVESYADGGFYLLRQREEGDKYEAVLYSDDVELEGDTLHAKFSGKVIYMSDDENTYYIPQTTYKGHVGDEKYYTISGSGVWNYKEEDGYNRIDESESIEIQTSVNSLSDELNIKGIFTITEPFGNLEVTDEQKAMFYSGKKEPINLLDWDEFVMISAFIKYLTRDENGVILDFWDWNSTDSVTGISCVPDTVKFNYGPVIEDGSKYFIMLSVQDTSDNRWSSELLPVKQSEAPTAKDNTRELTWDGTSDLTIFEDDYHSLVLSSYSNKGESTFAVKASNDGDKDYSYLMNAYTCNNTLYLGKYDSDYFEKCDYISADLDAGKKVDLDALGGFIRDAEIKDLQSIEFELSVQDDATGLPVKEETIKITINGETGIPISMKEKKNFPYRDLFEQDVFLWEEDGLKCELANMGGSRNDEYADLQMQFILTNTGDKDKTFRFGGLRCDGVYLADNLYALNKKIIIPAGKVCYHKVTIDDRNVEYQEIREFNDLRVETFVGDEDNEKTIWSDVKVDNSMKDHFSLGEIIFEHEGIKIGVVDYLKDSYSYQWKLAIENQSDEGIIINEGQGVTIDGVEHPDVFMSCHQRLSPGQKTYFEATFHDFEEDYNLSEGSTIQYNIEVLSDDFNSIIYKPEEPITLVAKRYKTGGN